MYPLLLLGLCGAVISLLPSPIEIETKTGRFLHITDLHYDPYYLSGSSVASSCHRVSEALRNGAGIFGAQQCDSPPELLHAVFNQTEIHGPFDFIIWTGDAARHDNDVKQRRTASEVIEANTRVTGLIREYFPNTIVIPSIGNNDLIWHNQLSAGPNENLRRLLETWKGLIPASQEGAFLTGGYFVVNVQPNLFVLSMNTLYFSPRNYVVPGCSESDSPGAHQLRWIRKQLGEIRAASGHAYLAGHIPPLSGYYGDACLQEYTRMVDDYQDVIVGQVFGHTNTDTFITMSSPKHPESISGVALVGPSVVPSYNPAVRVYYYSQDPSSLGTIADYLQLYADIRDANATTSLCLHTEYRATEVYGAGPLDVGYFARLKQSLKNDPELLRRFRRFKYVSYYK